MRSGSSARGRRARASQRASERSQSAAGSQSGRTRGGGRQKRKGASPRISLLGDRATGARATRSRAPGPGPKVRAPPNPAPQLGVVGTSPRPPWGWRGQGLGLSPRDPLIRPGGRAGQGRPPPIRGLAPTPHSAGAWTAPRSPVPLLPPPELWAPFLGVRLGFEDSPVFEEGC